MARYPNQFESGMERGEAGVFGGPVVEAKEVVHNDIACQGRESPGHVQGFLAGFELEQAGLECVDVTMNYVDDIHDGALGEPAPCQIGRCMHKASRGPLQSNPRDCGHKHFDPAMMEWATYMGFSAARLRLWMAA